MVTGGNIFIRSFRNALIAAGLLLTGCIKRPGKYETVEDFRKEFTGRKLFAGIAEGETLSLSRVIEITLLNNPTNLAAAQAVLAAKYSYFRALSAYAPEVNTRYSLGQ